ncbi:LOW QUALITY PROTEIN: nuclear cap-binding protein subunit 2-like [Rhinolophus ferrumequinum]|uniref:LOW QUALITY PROTEIN: nuclear cap-binding protein subunit 2-like n=1 Tax=Rhinolophus ferrumequinum TaxID=59479 RepID=UPI00140FDF01|nr:LOW QUALITY PROTEIN: nuclear cap-binding protein subunit 2-like [Rhinolophus ferrumequinum]
MTVTALGSYLKLSEYQDHKFSGDNEEPENLLKESCMLYVGNLSFYTTEEQIFELFSRCGEVRNVFMGLDKIKKKACGFCFVEYYNRAHAENAMWFLNGTFLDDRIICTDWDLSFREGRQYDRGQPGGGRVREESGENFDAGRGGSGQQAQACHKTGTCQ